MTTNIKLALNTLQLKGYLQYIYSPFHNYKTTVDLSLVNGLFLVPKGKAVNIRNGRILKRKSRENENPEIWVDDFGNLVELYNVAEFNPKNIYAKAGSLIDLNTEELNFDLNHPVDISVLPSYDGSVNLILNDGKNIPRLVNSRFSVREKNTYEIVDRIGENDTNIYSSDNFDKDSSLYFLYEDNPIILFSGFIDGILPVGLYCFYATYCDSDDNESDFIAETGLIPIFIGENKNPSSMDGGIKNLASNKGIKLNLTNIDKSYNYVKIYYVRYFADYGLNRVSECKKLVLKFPINSGFISILVTGNELSEDVDSNVLNLTRFNPKSVLTLAQCKNMLFFGNIVKNTDNYKELSDCALRILPRLVSETLNNITNNYAVNNDVSAGYYDVNNIYEKVGYHDLEFYRFGVVFIYKNGTLSNVYNTSGYELTPNTFTYNNSLYSVVNGVTLLRNYIQKDEFGWITNPELYINGGNKINAKGVCRINYNIKDYNTILGIRFDIPNEVIKHLLDDLNIRGLFFVRQKRIPNIIAQCFLIPMDDVLLAPVILKSKKQVIAESFLKTDYTLDTDYASRLRTFDLNSPHTTSYAAICPDFLLNLPYYNQIFNSSEFYLLKVSTNEDVSDDKLLINDRVRFYTLNSAIKLKLNLLKTKVTLCSVTEDVPTVAIKDKIYRLKVGEATEAYRFRSFGEDKTTYNAGGTDKSTEVTNIIRGVYSPYLAVYSNNLLECNHLYNIYPTAVLNETLEYQNRMDSNYAFYAISNRYNFNNLKRNGYRVDSDRYLICYRGDCFINTFTYRLNRNFNDPTLPNNDVIIDKNTWKDNYVKKSPKDISRSDVNAVPMGSWITFKLFSSSNYALRSVDHSYVSEEATMGTARTFYPKSPVMYLGDYKKPDSYLYNDAYRATLGYKAYFTLSETNYIKDTFSNRIQYSSVAILDSFKNNFRESFSTYYRDYSLEYGGITKLVETNGNLLVVFEHGIGLAVINERVLAGQGEGDPVFINTNNVLPLELSILSDTFGSQWTESIIKADSGIIYGVDTVSKKIWSVSNGQLNILSDFQVNQFLIDNITLGERELNPIIGLKNVKTHYNNNKKDVLFTFYDDIYKDEEKVWNLCYNELLGKFITFYSWVPSYSENIDTQFFTFDRRTSKILSLLYNSNYNIPTNTGILLDTPISSINNFGKDSFNNFLIRVYYRDIKDGVSRSTRIVDENGYSTSLENIISYENKDIEITILKDHWENYKLFKIEKPENSDYSNIVPYSDDSININDSINRIIEILKKRKYISLILKASINNLNLKTLTIIFTTQKCIDNITTDFYLHGNSGIYNAIEELLPTHWYGEYHPFEFEFVVNEKTGILKVFYNLEIISNKAEPESFHFEIEGDNYEFSADKRAMYFRQEATKEQFLNLGSDMLFDRKYQDVAAPDFTLELYYRKGSLVGNSGIKDYTDLYNKRDRVYPIESGGLVLLVKSTIFPLYYERIDSYDDIYHIYRGMLDDNPNTGYDFKNLSGSEILWNRRLNQFNIVTHIKNSPINLYGRLRGNSSYKEGKWFIQIPSIIFNLSNEPSWGVAEGSFILNYSSLGGKDKLLDENNNGILKKLVAVPPMVINSSNIPNDLDTLDITPQTLPNIYTKYHSGLGDFYSAVDTSHWTLRKEARIRDKWIKVRVRYSGKNLAIIHSVITLFNVSLS